MNPTSEKPIPSSPAAPTEPPRNRPLPNAPRRRGFRPGRWLLLIVILAGAAFAWSKYHSSAPASASGHAHGGRGMHGGGEDPNAPVPVVVANAEQRDFPIYLDGLGTVQAFNSVTVRPRVDGEIQKIFFQEGQDIKKGDQLAQIDPRPYQAQLDQAAAKKAQDEAQLANAQAMLARDDVLMKTKVLDQQTYDTQKYSVAQLTALVAADQAAINNAQTQLDYTRMISPISGRAGIRQVDEGNLVHANDTTGIVVINEVQPISVLFTLPQQQLADVRKAMLGGQTLKVTAVDRNNLTPLGDGTLAVVDNQIDPTTATVKLKATFANADFHLWPGQFVNVRLLLEIRPKMVCVPSAAIQRGPNGPYVYIVQPNSTVAMTTVKPGPEEDGWTLIEDGVKAGDRVVVDGQYRLKPDSTVTISGKGDAAAAPASKHSRS